MFTATRVQVATYLLGVCPFSIAFLVFLNSSVSFVITDLIGREKGVGDAVGNLGFADELLALVACPLWGLLSDRIGVRYVRQTQTVRCPANFEPGLCFGLLLALGFLPGLLSFLVRFLACLLGWSFLLSRGFFLGRRLLGRRFLGRL